MFEKHTEDLMKTTLGIEDEKWLRLYAIMADSDTMHEIKYALEQNDAYLEKHGLTLHYLFKPMKKDFEYYREVDLQNNTKNPIKAQPDLYSKDGQSFNASNPIFLNATHNIKKEGVYYLSYIYEQMNTTK